MSQYMNTKLKAESRKRKREMKENPVEVSSKPPALTNAERMKQYRLRRKLGKADNNSEPVVAMPEPIPGRSIDPVMFENVSQRTSSFHGMLLKNKQSKTV